MNTHRFRVAVIIPTFRRPESFDRAAKSVLRQVGLEPLGQVQLILTDNDPQGSALKCARAIEADAPAHFAVSVLHEPEPGVANVRNTAITVAEARHIVFLDDDQSAPPDWLSRFVAGHEALGTAASFGPIDTALPSTKRRYTRYLNNFFDRHGPTRTQLIPNAYGCGNAALDMDQMPKGSALFDMRANETGGEDDRLFDRIKAKGGRFGWVSGALVIEHVPESRAHLRYTLRRAFAYGQGPSFRAAQAGLFSLPIVSWHMAIGFCQALVCGLAGVGLLAIRHDAAAWWLDKAARGLGKLLWMNLFRQRFYGRASQPADAPVPTDKQTAT